MASKILQPGNIIGNKTLIRIARGEGEGWLSKEETEVMPQVQASKSLVGSSTPINKHRLEEAIKVLVDKGEYPSAERISKELGRSSGNLNGFEVKARREIFNRLGIEMTTQGGGRNAVY